MTRTNDIFFVVVCLLRHFSAAYELIVQSSLVHLPIDKTRTHGPIERLVKNKVLLRFVDRLINPNGP